MIKSLNKFIKVVTVLSLLSIFILSGFSLTKYWIELKIENNNFDEIRELKTNANIVPLTESTNSIKDDTNNNTVMSHMLSLYNQNPDTIGWISIKGTSIDYPVMYTPSDYDYYLYHSFKKEKSKSGVPFLGDKCSLESDNIIIHGHNMKNGSMFSDLTNYAKKSFYTEHNKIIFTSLNEEYEYQIISVFKTKAIASNEDGFRYYEIVDFNTEKDFNNYIETVKNLSIYPIDESAKYGDKLLTLSTCSYHVDNGRFVVIAKLIN